MAVHALAFFISEDTLLQNSWELRGPGCCQAQAGAAACTLSLCSPPACRGVGGGLPLPAIQTSAHPQTHHQGCQLVPTGAYWVLRQPCCYAITGKWKQPVPAILLGFFPSLFFYYCMVTTIKSLLAWHFIWELFPYMTVLYPCVNYLMFHYTNRLHLQKLFPAGKNQMLELQVFCRGESVLRQWDRGSRPAHSCWAGAVMLREEFIFKNCLKKKASGSKGENNHCLRCTRDIESQGHWLCWSHLWEDLEQQPLK